MTSKMLLPVILTLVVLRLSPMGEPVKVEEIIAAIDDSYDNSASFDSNVQDIHALLCPESVFCPDEDRSDLPYIDHINRIISSTDTTTNNRSISITEARRFVFEHASELYGCCKFCTCAPDCFERGNCCPSMLTQSGEVQQTAFKQECIYAGIEYYINGGKFIELYEFYGHSFYMVADCFYNITGEHNQTARKCKDPDMYYREEVTPVYSHKTDRTYRNMFCAICNNDNDHTTAWTMKLFLPIDMPLATLSALLSTEEGLYRRIIRSSRRINILFIPPNAVRSKAEDSTCVFPLSSKRSFKTEGLPLSGNNASFFDLACKSVTTTYHNTMFHYDNIFCYFYSKHYLRPIIPTECTTIDPRNFERPFTAILTYLDQEETPVSESNNDNMARCKCNEYYDPVNVSMIRSRRIVFHLML